MPRVFLSHSSLDKEFVRALAEHLKSDGIDVWLDEAEIAPGDNIVSKIADGLESDVVLFIMSPDSIRSNWVKEEWTDAYWEQTNKGHVKLAGVLYRDCAIPRLIRNKKYFDLRTNHPEGFREIVTWILTEHPAPPPRVNILPTRPPLFIGRETDLAQLQTLLQPGAVVGLSGMPGRGKTTLALEFAHRAQTQFAAVYWVPCESGSLASISGDLARQLGLSLTGDLPQIVAELKLACGRKRCLLILDNVETNDLGALIPGGAASVLVTTRQPGLGFLQLQPAVALALFSEEQCFELFRRVLGETEVAAQEGACGGIFQAVEYLPLAVNLLARLIKYSARHTIASHAARLPADVTVLIGEALGALPAEPRRLITAMAACAPASFRLSLAASLAGFDEAASLDALDILLGRSLVEEVDRGRRRYRLHALIRAAADGREFAQAHATAVNEQFQHWETNWQTCAPDLPDFQLALTWAITNSASFTEWLGYYGWALTYRIGRPAEAFEISARLGEAAEKREDKNAAQRWFGKQALILQAWGRLEEALALHKKEEGLCLELGDKHGLQSTYGNQARILEDWGRLEEALALLEKVEVLSLETDDKDSLQRTYGNQALILQDWGRLEEALALQKKKEALCLELGNKDGLQRTYGNQAGILQDWGRLDEALALHKQQEALCLELGNKDSLQRSYGNQAMILTKWGRLEEALALHKQKETLCLDLNNKSSLGYCYWQWAHLARAKNDPETAHAKLTAALALFTEINMPRQRDAVAAELERAAGASAS